MNFSNRCASRRSFVYSTATLRLWGKFVVSNREVLCATDICARVRSTLRQRDTRGRCCALPVRLSLPFPGQPRSLTAAGARQPFGTKNQAALAALGCCLSVLRFVGRARVINLRSSCWWIAFQLTQKNIQGSIKITNIILKTDTFYVLNIK
jgi:hypothetical protein